MPLHTVRASSHECRALVATAATAMLVAVLLGLTAPSNAAAAQDAVQQRISAAYRGRDITYADARALHATWRESAVARTRLIEDDRWQRAGEIAATRGVAMGLAKRGQLTSDRLEPALLSVKATTHVMLHESFPGNEREITIPGEVVKFKYYSGRGVQFQPFETFKDGNAQATWMEDPAGARRVADRMIELSVMRGGAVTWEYYFPFEGTSVPWASSISQALATEFFQHVADQASPTDQARYADVARAGLPLFSTHPTRGGVAVGQGSGRWFLIYSHHPSQRVLNGHLQVLVNLHKYHELTGSPQALAIMNQGIRAVIPLLPQFDTGAWSRYQLGAEADLGYHDFQTSQLEKLGERTEIPQFQDYAHKFATYRRTPPTIVVPPQSWPAILPVADGFRDEVTIRYRVDKRSRESILIKNRAGTLVRAFSTSGPTGVHTVTWDARDRNGRTVPEGAYTVAIVATDIVGNSRSGQLTSPVMVGRDRTPPVVQAHAIRQDGPAASIVAVRSFDAGSGYIDIRVALDGKVLALRRVGRSGLVGLEVPRTVAALQRATLVLTDSSGNTVRVPLEGGTDRG